MQGGEDVAELAVGQSEAVEVRGTAFLGVGGVGAAPDVGAVGDGQVEEYEVGLIGVKELLGVLLEVEVGKVALMLFLGA